MQTMKAMIRHVLLYPYYKFRGSNYSRYNKFHRGHFKKYILMGIYESNGDQINEKYSGKDTHDLS